LSTPNDPSTSAANTPGDPSEPATPSYLRDDVERTFLESVIASFQRWEDRLGQGMVSMIMMLFIFALMMIYAFNVDPI
jgi:hypothetical protein